MFAAKEAAALAVLNPLPLKAVEAVPQETPDPRDQFENVTPAGGVVQVAVGVAGQVTEAPPPTVTIVWAVAIPVNKNNGNSNNSCSVFNLDSSNSFFISSGILYSQFACDLGLF